MLGEAGGSLGSRVSEPFWVGSSLLGLTASLPASLISGSQAELDRDLGVWLSPTGWLGMVFLTVSELLELGSSVGSQEGRAQEVHNSEMGVGCTSFWPSFGFSKACLLDRK